MDAETAWLQLTLAAKEYFPQQLEDALLAAGAVAVTLTDGADQPVLEPAPGATPLWPHTRVTGLFPVQTDIAVVRRRLVCELGPDVLGSAELAALEDRDWVRAWLEDYRPMRFGRRLWVCPSTVEPPAPHAVNLILDPGLAFGTGTHPTTASCLEWLDSMELTDQAVIDYGCGSGILAVAAALLGAARVWATDIDPQALTACAANAARNGVAGRIAITAPEQLGEQSVDVLLANILSGPLIQLAERLQSLVRPSGQLVLSGILAEQLDAVQTAYQPWFEFAVPHRCEDWLLLVARRRPFTWHPSALTG